MQKSNRDAVSSIELNQLSPTHNSHQISFNGIIIKPNSPRTIQACQILGIDLGIFQIKDLNSFRANDTLNEEIIQMRYEHYVNKTTQLISEILQKRKEIVRKNKQRQLQCVSIDSLDRSKSVKQQVSTIDSTDIKKQMDFVYNRAISYIQKKETAENIALTNGENVDLQEFEGGLTKEVTRYNKHKIQKMREAQIKLEEDKKRVELFEKIQERDQRIVQTMMKKQQEIKDKYSQQKKEVKRLNTQEMEIKSQQKESEAMRNSAMLSEVRNKIVQRSDDQKVKQKRELALKRKEEFERQIDQECQQQMIKIQLKLENSEKLQKEQIQSRVEKIKELNQKDQYIMQHQKQQKERLSQEHFTQLIEKMVSKEKEFQTIQKSIQSIEQEKKQEQKQKQKKLRQNQGDLFKDRDEKLKELNEKFRKIDEFNKQKKEELENKILLKQELRKLKDQDKQDILERQKRKNEYRMLEITEKYKVIDEKNELKQYQNNLLQQTSMHISKQESMERNRIYSQLQQMSDNLFNKKVRKRNLSTLEKNVFKIQTKGKILKEDTEFEDHTRLLITMLQINDLEETQKMKLSKRN